MKCLLATALPSLASLAGGIIGGEQYLKWRTGLDLCVKLASRARAEQDLVAAGFLEFGRDFFYRLGEVCSNGDLNFFRLRRLQG